MTQEELNNKLLDAWQNNKRLTFSGEQFNNLTFNLNFITDYKNITFISCNFNKCFFEHCKILNSFFKNCTFIKCEMDFLNLVETTFKLCSFRQCLNCGNWVYNCIMDDVTYNEGNCHSSSFHVCHFISSVAIDSNFNHSFFPASSIEKSAAYHSMFREAELSATKIKNSFWEDCADLDMKCPETGPFIGYKRTKNAIVTLFIPEDAKRSSATGDKCRCSKAKVIDIEFFHPDVDNSIKTASIFDPGFYYELGKTVEIKDFNENRWEPCASGIHFFMTKEKARDYM